MNEQEINYFLDGVTAKQDLITSIEGLREELARAMAPMMVPKLKAKPKVTSNGIFGDAEQVYESSLNQYEKATLLYMLLNPGIHTPKSIATACSFSESSAKRAISQLMLSNRVMRAPYQNGFKLTKHV